MRQNELELKDIDSEDLEDLLARIATSFNISFEEGELMHITTFGQLCDHIKDKIQLESAEDCTSQQAFYKLREALSLMFQTDKKIISPDTLLVNFFPRQNRRRKVEELEERLGFKINIVGPPQWLVGTLIFLMIGSVLGSFVEKTLGLIGVFSFVGLQLAIKLGNELKVKTIGQAAEEMARENYMRSRRNPQTFNKAEIEKILTDWFSDHFYINKNKLNRDAKFA